MIAVVSFLRLINKTTVITLRIGIWLRDNWRLLYLKAGFLKMVIVNTFTMIIICVGHATSPLLSSRYY